MEILKIGKGVKLRSHLGKYMVAGDDDQETIRQSRNGSSRKAIWTVESVDEKPNFIRLRTSRGKYLTASSKPFLLGMTGEKVTQTASSTDWQTQWEPIRDGFQVKLRSWCGKWLRANGGTPPWRNSVTHDEPHTSKTKSWVLWDVEMVEDEDGLDGTASFDDDDTLSSISSCDSSVSSYVTGSVASMKSLRSSFGSSMSPRRTPIPKVTDSNATRRPAMEFFQKAKAVRLRNVHNKYLMADDDEETVTQDRNGSSSNARWTVEVVRGSSDSGAIRLKSCHGRYLTASNERFLLGATGRKVVQSKPTGRLDSSVEWEPVREGSKVKLRTPYGHYLRANGGLPPWRNSVTHDTPHRTATQEWVFWDVDVVEILVEPNQTRTPSPPPEQVPRQPSPPSAPAYHPVSRTPSSASTRSDLSAGHEVPTESPPKLEGRKIYFQVAIEAGDLDDEALETPCFNFKGNSVHQLTEKLKDQTGFGDDEDIMVCTTSPLNGKLFPLRLQLPPNNFDLHVVLVPSNSLLAEDVGHVMKFLG